MMPAVDIGLMANEVNGEEIVVYDGAYGVIVADKVVEEDQLGGGVPGKHMWGCKRRWRVCLKMAAHIGSHEKRKSTRNSARVVKYG
jgi:hypothetical protein